MILVGLFCVLGAIGLLIAGLAQADQDLVWASITASALGGLAVAIAAVQRGRALRRAEGADEAAGQASPATDAFAGDTPVVDGPGQSRASWPAADAQDAEDAEDADRTDVADDEQEPGEDEATDPVDEPGEEDVDMADLLMIIDLSDDVLVVDLRPRYHLAVCGHLQGRQAIPLPVNEAREDGFTPCGLCRPDATLAGRARQLKSADN